MEGAMQTQSTMSYGSDYHFVPALSVNHGKGLEVLPDLYCFTDQIVMMAGHPDRQE
jgi:hypothetical protein